MILKYELRFVAFTWPNLCLWVIILSGICKLKPKKTKKNLLKNLLKKTQNLIFCKKKHLGFYQPWMPHTFYCSKQASRSVPDSSKIQIFLHSTLQDAAKTRTLYMQQVVNTSNTVFSKVLDTVSCLVHTSALQTTKIHMVPVSSFTL